MKTVKYLWILPFVALMLFVPNQGKAWYDSTYIYRSTVTGSGIHDTGSKVYEIVNQQSNFSESEQVYVLTRIFNITHVDRFQFKFQLYDRNGTLRSELYSPLYQPRGDWWAETYAWHNFGKLDSGNYEIRVNISLNNEGYKYLDRKLITVEGGYYDNNYYQDDDYYDNSYYNNYKNPGYNNDYYNNYNYYQPPHYYQPTNYYHDPEYTHNWTYTGTGIEEYASYKYTIKGRTDEFEENEDVYVLTKLADISGIREFRVKHELYANGNSLRSSDESPVYRPNYNDWDYNYNYHNFGRLPEGEHTIKVFIKVDNENYKQIASVKVKVGDEYDNYTYHYDWSKSDTRVRYMGNYRYEMNYDKNTFYSDEDFRVLTKLSNIAGVDTFQVRHELRYSGGALYRRMDGAVQRPEYRRWDYNYTETNFGKVPVGDYKLEVSVRVNNGSYKLVNTRTITVKNRGYNATNVNTNYHPYNNDRYTPRHDTYNPKPTYDYSWTRYGTQGYPQQVRTAYNYY